MLLLGIKANPNADMVPRTVLIGGKVSILIELIYAIIYICMSGKLNCVVQLDYFTITHGNFLFNVWLLFAVAL